MIGSITPASSLAADVPSHPAGLELTGERTVPGARGENYWFRRHQAAYLALRHEVTGPKLLEVGAGEGYGAALFAEHVQTVLALDYDRSTIGQLATRYPQLCPVRANLAALPCPTEAFDTVASLQTIEHVWDHRQFLLECRRVLRPGGVLLLTTPNRLTFSPGLTKPANPFHTHEFTEPELLALVTSAGFGQVTVRGLFAGSRLTELDRRHGSFTAAQLASPPAAWSTELTADVDSVRPEDFELRAADLDASLDLIVWARRA